MEEPNCADFKDCVECVNRKRCGWCSSAHTCMLTANSACIDDFKYDSRSCTSLMKKNEDPPVERACGLATNCYACRRMSHCVWLAIDTKRICVSKSEHGKIVSISTLLDRL
jgi:hypothetical protein